MHFLGGKLCLLLTLFIPCAAVIFKLPYCGMNKGNNFALKLQPVSIASWLEIEDHNLLNVSAVSMKRDNCTFWSLVIIKPKPISVNKWGASDWPAVLTRPPVRDDMHTPTQCMTGWHIMEVNYMSCCQNMNQQSAVMMNLDMCIICLHTDSAVLVRTDSVSGRALKRNSACSYFTPLRLTVIRWLLQLLATGHSLDYTFIFSSSPHFFPFVLSLRRCLFVGWCIVGVAAVWLVGPWRILNTLQSLPPSVTNPPGIVFGFRVCLCRSECSSVWGPSLGSNCDFID